ncbi:TPA: hypothetical protein ACGOZH_001857 [Streptococcus suis]
MQKTKLGIGVGLMGAAVCFLALFEGYTPMLIAVGYILLFEENEWLKKTGVKALAVLFVFSVFITVIDFIPDCLNIVSSFLGIFNFNVYFSVIRSMFSVLIDILSLFRTVILILLGYKALSQGTIKVPFVDTLINKYMGE